MSKTDLTFTTKTSDIEENIYNIKKYLQQKETPTT